MRNLEFKANGAVNPQVLDQEIKAAVGEGVIGISTDGDGGVIVHLEDSTDEKAAQLAITGALKDHDPRVKSAEQEAQEAVVTRVRAFIEAPEIDTRNALTTAQLTAKVAELEGLVRLLLGARES